MQSAFVFHLELQRTILMLVNTEQVETAKLNKSELAANDASGCVEIQLLILAFGPTLPGVVDKIVLAVTLKQGFLCLTQKNPTP